MKVNKFSVARAIRINYSEYWDRGIQSYPVAECAPFCKVSDKWGVFSNFGNTPIKFNGITFRNSEQLFQMLKFTSIDAVIDIYNVNGQSIKMKAKKWGKICARPDWDKMIVDVMKFAISEKYKQNQDFRKVLEESQGLYIVEDQTSFPGITANTWGAKLIDGYYVGPNLMGQLIMELRDNHSLDYLLPDDTFKLLEALKDKNFNCHINNGE